MDANATPLLDLFEKKMRLEVPLFQRQYVWNREQQWEPLWEDISRKFTDFIEGRKDSPVHFLGAMVLDQKMTPSTHVERRQVIDGQQRLTTFQIFLAALRDFCREQQCEKSAKEFDRYTINEGKMADPDVDRFKVWPTQLDRDQFRDVMTIGSGKGVETKHPLVKKKWARKYEQRPRMVEAYLYFCDVIREFFLGGDDIPLEAAMPLEERVDEAFSALKTALQVVSIDLTKDDDAQVIFETLNARGEPLLPADLLRNYIFLRAARLGEPVEDLYKRYWSAFDDNFWRQEVTQGRLSRPRSDLFMQHFLASRRCIDIPIKHLYVEYRFWIDREQPFKTVQAEVEALSRQGQDFRRVLEPRDGDPVAGLARFMETFDVRTAYPLLLHLMDTKLTLEEWSRVSTILESYLLRRAIVGWTTKAYNRIFLNLTKLLARNGATGEALEVALAELSGESSRWPSDAEFWNAWQSADSYNRQNVARLSHVFRRLTTHSLTTKMEDVIISGDLTVEHLMPQNWIEHWPLPNGERGMEVSELYSSKEEDPRNVATRVRNARLQTMGNLTVLTKPLNSAVSNGPWARKRAGILENSLLPINQRLHTYEKWDEAAIEKRGKELFEIAINIWPRPR